MDASTSKFDYIQNLKLKSEILAEFPEWESEDYRNGKTMFEMKEVEFSTRESRMAIESGQADISDFKVVYDTPELAKYQTDHKILSNNELAEKFEFLRNTSDTNTYDIFRAYDYYTSNGTMPENISLGDLNEFMTDSKFASGYSDFNNLSDYSKMQMYQMELIYRSNNIAEIQAGLQRYTTGAMENTRVFYDLDGKVVGMDFSEVFGSGTAVKPNNAVFSTTVGDVKKYMSGDAMSSICPEYNNLSDLQKLQMGQLELNGRNHNLTDMALLFQDGSAGSTGNVRIAFDADGKIMGIDASSLTSGRAMDFSSGSAVFDIASDGSMSVKLQNAPDGSAWWHKEGFLSEIIMIG